MLSGFMKPGAMDAEPVHRKNMIKPARGRAKQTRQIGIAVARHSWQDCQPARLLGQAANRGVSSGIQLEMSIRFGLQGPIRKGSRTAQGEQSFRRPGV